MRPLIFTTVYGKRWYYFGDRLINSIREAGYDGDIMAICDTGYSPCGDAKTFRLNLNEMDVVDDRPEMSRIWMTRYYIDRIGCNDYTDYLYLDADCVVVPGQQINEKCELLRPGNWFTRDRGKPNPNDQGWINYFGKAIPPKLIQPNWCNINSGTWKIEGYQDLSELCSGVRKIYQQVTTIIADQAALNAYIRLRCKIEYLIYREFLIGFINSYDYDLAARLKCCVAHELGAMKGMNYHWQVFR